MTESQERVSLFEATRIMRELCPPNTRVTLRGRTHRAKSHLANFGDQWTVKHATGSKHEGIFVVADGPLFEAMWLGPDYEVVLS